MPRRIQDEAFVTDRERHALQQPRHVTQRFEDAAVERHRHLRIFARALGDGRRADTSAVVNAQHACATVVMHRHRNAPHERGNARAAQIKR